MNGLTPQELMVYDYIYHCTNGTDNTVSQRDIYEFMLRTPWPLKWDDKQNMHNDHIRKLHTIVEHINKSIEVEKFIFHHAYRYNIATDAQVENMIWFYDHKASAALGLKSFIAKKAKRNGQFDLFTEKAHEAFNELK